MTASGASAKRHDIIRNLTTGTVATVTGASQFGRLLTTRGPMERYAVEVVAEAGPEHALADAHRSGYHTTAYPGCPLCAETGR
jgi:hypothetical protein